MYQYLGLSCVYYAYSLTVINQNNQAWRDGSENKVLQLEAQEPEFESKVLTKLLDGHDRLPIVQCLFKK